MARVRINTTSSRLPTKPPIVQKSSRRRLGLPTAKPFKTNHVQLILAPPNIAAKSGQTRLTAIWARRPGWGSSSMR